jgi:hypothetical protein
MLIFIIGFRCSIVNIGPLTNGGGTLNSFLERIKIKGGCNYPLIDVAVNFLFKL